MNENNKLTTKDKAGLIYENLKEAKKWGLEMFLPTESISESTYELWLNHETPDVVVVYCTYKGIYEIRVPGFEATTGDFNSTLSILNQIIDEIGY